MNNRLPKKMSIKELKNILEKMDCVEDPAGHNQKINFHMRNKKSGKHFYIPLAGCNNRKIQSETIQSVLKHAGINKQNFINNLY
ncbi:MAG: hypothetical protein ABH919_02035 [bacterium]